VESDEGLDRQAEEIGDLLDFPRLQKNAAFAVATLSAFLALKSLHWPQTHTDNTRHFFCPHAGTNKNILYSMTNYKTKRFIRAFG
jgi:hypothetical protein